METVVPPRCRCRWDDVVPALERDQAATAMDFNATGLPTAPFDNVYLRCGVCGKRRPRERYNEHPDERAWRESKLRSA